MIKSFRHKGVRLFFETGSKGGIQAKHAARLARMLMVLNRASQPEDMDLPGWYLHPLKGASLRGHWSVRVSGNWRLTFAFDGADAILGPSAQPPRDAIISVSGGLRRCKSSP